MKILCVIASYYPAVKMGGPVFSLHDLCKELAKNNDVTVYTTDYLLKNICSVNKELVTDGVKVTYFYQYSCFNFIGPTGWQFSIDLTMALNKNLPNFDIVYLVGIWNYPIAIAAYFCRKLKKPYIISPRGSLYPVTFGKKFWKKKIYLGLISRRDLMHAAAIHYTTYDEFIQCHSYFQLKNGYIIVPNGLDLSKFERLPQKNALVRNYPELKNKKIILFLGRINWKKGIDLLIKSLALIYKQENDIHLLICGESDPSSYILKVMKWIRKYDLEGKVTFVGMVTGLKKFEVLMGSEVFVLPSYSESFGMAVIEAMICGLPVIVSEYVAIHKDIEMAAAGLVTNMDETKIAEAIIKVLSSNDLRTSLGENGKRLVRDKFDIEKIAGQMHDEFFSLIKRTIDEYSK